MWRMLPLFWEMGASDLVRYAAEIIECSGGGDEGLGDEGNIDFHVIYSARIVHAHA